MRKKGLVNGGLLLGSVLATFLLLEIVVERYFITSTPLKFHFALSDSARWLAQSSKRGPLPSHYIALVGDSYAQGKGDWLLQADPDHNSPFHSAHLLQSATGRDVVSFGRRHRGSIGGWVVEPTALFGFLRKHVDDELEQPEQVLAYFYAGNDVTDNLADLRGNFLAQHDDAQIADDAALDAFMEAEAQRRRGLGALPWLPLHRGWLPSAVWRVMGNMLHGHEDKDIADGGVPTGIVNLARVADREIALPDGLQGPALDVDEAELEQALRVTRVALARLHRLFEPARLTVVYIPSVLESYPWTSAQISYAKRAGSGSETGATAQLWQRSQLLCRRVQQIAQGMGAAFVDARKAVRAAAQNGLVHGPRDWLHFNQAGYQALVAAIVDHPATDCASL
ncbi:MAG: SGNH/GDSL hydrolase family protein [Methylococcaceae bacterium]|nr:MAG: SGNH/GDSL hydrolase family protein [Methylococcaceae bacterium]